MKNTLEDICLCRYRLRSEEVVIDKRDARVESKFFDVGLTLLQCLGTDVLVDKLK